MTPLLVKIKTFLQSLSFRTGVIVLALCIPFYILSFAQMLLPISVGAKATLWTVLFGLAKTCQYGGLTILGAEGFRRVKQWLKRRNKQNTHAADEGASVVDVDPLGSNHLSNED